jgi:hypothetical protein
MESQIPFSIFLSDVVLGFESEDSSELLNIGDKYIFSYTAHI